MHLVIALAAVSGLPGTLSRASADEGAEAQTLEQRLLAEDPQKLADAARQQGDPARGALLFHQPQLTCARCHLPGDDGPPLGPDLARPEQKPSGADLVQALLEPSKTIRKGYEPVVVLTVDGQSITGLLVQQDDRQIVVRDAAQHGKQVRIAREEVDQVAVGAQSLMPAGLVNQLADLQQFYDLLGYLTEIADKGPSRALELQPPAHLFAAVEVPQYEQRVDHAGLIRDWNAEGFKRGEAIYNRLCVNCHGRHDQPGSLPTSPRFAQQPLKAGSDPYSMYRTLTYGFGMMTPQTWMVPQQKYDVIHYIREAYFKQHNAAFYTRIDGAYLARLPQGDTRGPAPSTIQPWVVMDYGPSLINTYEIGTKANIAYKGIAVRLDAGPGGIARGRQWMIFDHDTLRLAAAWSGQGFIDWQGIHFDGRHNAHPSIVGQIHVANPPGPGWADPRTGRFDDPRLRGRDGKPYGPLPRAWAHYKGLYAYGDQTIFTYTVGEASVLEMFGYERISTAVDASRQPADAPQQPADASQQPADASQSTAEAPVFTRTLNVGAAPHALLLRVAPRDVAVAVIGGDGVEQLEQDGFAVVRIPARATPLNVKILMSSAPPAELKRHAASSPSPLSLEVFTKGGPPRWPQMLTTRATLGSDDGPLAADVLVHPKDNPYLAQMRLTGIEFFPDGRRAAVTAWDGDVWLVDGVDQPQQRLTWRRIASGLFQPLGVRIVEGKIYVTCRDQIVILHDLTGNGETDFYENFNNDHQVTEHFHEFAMGLQTDADGNFYYAKSARHALPALVPHHGTLLRVSRDGHRTDILATGFRAANGVCLNPDGSFFVTDQEGHWIPKNRINWVRADGPPRFYGNMLGYHDVTDSSDGAMEPPLCWITNALDRSPSELLWVPRDHWGPLAGSLLNLSYGYGKLYVVLHERVGDTMQGGICELPLPAFPTGVMRGRFHPQNGHLYACGMFAWAGSVTQPGGLYRVRSTGRPIHVPLQLRARPAAIELEFSGALDPASVADVANWSVKSWSLRRSSGYGSQHHGEKPLAVRSAVLLADGRTVRLELPDLAPTWSMEIKYSLRGGEGTPVRGMVHNTIHTLGADAD